MHGQHLHRVPALASAGWALNDEAVYLVEITDGLHAERVIGEWIAIWNSTARVRASVDKPPTRPKTPTGPWI